MNVNNALLSLGLFAVSGCTTSSVSSYHVLVDNSGSIPRGLVEVTQRHVLDTAREWITTASPGDNFTLWWFAASGSHPAHRRTLTMPTLGVPAYAARGTFAAAAIDTLEGWFNDVPQDTKHTPLLETIFFIGLTQDEPWNLTILSDLHQDSPTWNARRHNPDDDETLLDRMLELCPMVKIPPATISLITWPGRAVRGRNPVQDNLRNRSLFDRFFRRWSPPSRVDVSSM